MEVNEIIQELKKRVNISADAEVTMARSRDTWKNLTNAQKQEVLALADVGQTVAHNTYKNGHLAAPIALAMAKVAGINPAYLAGTTDKKGRFTEKTVHTFLSGLGYAFADNAPEDAAEQETITVAEDVAAEGFSKVDEEAAAVECECEAPAEQVLELPEDELYILLKAQLIKARVSDEARRTLAEIQALLVR